VCLDRPCELGNPLNPHPAGCLVLVPMMDCKKLARGLIIESIGSPIALKKGGYVGSWRRAVVGLDLITRAHTQNVWMRLVSRLCNKL
jgi:hypothetical protein